VPVFTYTYDTGAAAQPANIREVNITLIVQSPQIRSTEQQVACGHLERAGATH